MTKRRGKPFDYDVCLSFAGEERSYVEKVADSLRNRGCRVFYDEHEVASLWGKDLYTHLDYVYGSAARYCVLFASKNYAKKLWTAHERQSAQARAFSEHSEYILPARFDDTQIPGLRETTGYVDLGKLKPRELADLIVEKLSTETREQFFPPVPDRLYAHLGANTERAQERVRHRANKFFSMLVRMSKAERRLVYTVFSTGCPTDMPQNMHADLDWLRRELKWPPRKIVEVARGLASVGFSVTMRTGHRGRGRSLPDSPTRGVLVFEWIDGSVSSPFRNPNGTDIASAVIEVATDDYCNECGWHPLDHLDFSALSTATSMNHRHEADAAEAASGADGPSSPRHKAPKRGRVPAATGRNPTKPMRAASRARRSRPVASARL